MGFNYSPNIVSDGLVFYVDPLNFKSRDRYVGLTGGTIVNLTSSYGFSGELLNDTLPSGTTPLISSDYKYINFDGIGANISFFGGGTELSQLQQPYFRYKPQTFTFSAWIKSGTTGPGGVMYWAGANDYWLQTPALTATTYTPGIYTGVVGENWSATTPTQSSYPVPSIELTINGDGIITKAIAETLSGTPFAVNKNMVVKISGSTIGGLTPQDDAYLLWRSATSSGSRWGFQLGDNYSLFLSDSINSGGFNTDRISNEPNKWNLITLTDEGQLLTEGNRKCYVNGELVNSSPSGDTTWLNGSQMKNGTINAASLFMGKGTSSTFASYLEGSLGPCKMYDRALTRDEVIRNYNALKERFKEPPITD